MKKIGLFIKRDEKAINKANELEKWLTSKGFFVLKKENIYPTNNPFDNQKIPIAPPDLFCVFVLGGDGTFLSAARWIGEQDIPVLGIKFGDVGFLAETIEEDLFTCAEKIINNEFSIEPRTRLFIRLIRNEQEIASQTALNDIVINKGALARLAHIETYINDSYLTTYRSDGLIIATPTGSTAYSLAAGGPIVYPSLPSIILTPICPFTLTNRPLIIPDNVKIKIKITEQSTDIVLTCDGQIGYEIGSYDTILVTKGKRPVKMITMSEHHYFDVLKTKLRWSGGRI
ncbi:MAG: NAD(+)/NADH kinase [Desulfobacterales bacterium]|nr:NAD(+)/NADH kinase [Desulfobacterales bacterium]